MRSQSSDKEILQLLTQLQQVIHQVNQSVTIKTTHAFAELVEKLKLSIEAFPEKHFSYEFYETASETVEEITQLRLENELRPILKEMKLIEQFDAYSAIIRKAVSRHESVAKRLTEIPIPPTENMVLAARLKLEAATQLAAEATAAAEKANSRGMEYLAEMQAQQIKTAGLIDPKFLKSSFAHSLAIYAINTAAVLATDAAAAALIEYEDLEG